MRWIKKHVGLYIRSVAKEVQWVTPSGFIVNQRRDDIETQQMELQLLGRTQVRIPTGRSTPSPNKHKSSTAPNYIHSFDASILHRSFMQFDEPNTVIHDSVLAEQETWEHSIALCEAYTNIFSEECWLSKFAETINASEPPPIVGTLDPKVVSNSTYFFC